jgi:hypothetical protein
LNLPASRDEQFKQAFFKYGGGALVALVAIMCAYSGWTLSKSHIPTLALSDSETLKDVRKKKPLLKS